MSIASEWDRYVLHFDVLDDEEKQAQNAFYMGALTMLAAASLEPELVKDYAAEIDAFLAEDAREREAAGCPCEACKAAAEAGIPPFSAVAIVEGAKQ